MHVFPEKRNGSHVNRMQTLVVNEERRRLIVSGVAGFPRGNDAQLDDVTDRREHVTRGHVTV